MIFSVSVLKVVILLMFELFYYMKEGVKFFDFKSIMLSNYVVI